MNRVFNKAVVLGYANIEITQTQNTGVKAGRRADFTYGEFVWLVMYLRHWLKASRA